MKAKFRSWSQFYIIGLQKLVLKETFSSQIRNHRDSNIFINVKNHINNATAQQEQEIYYTKLIPNPHSYQVPISWNVITKNLKFQCSKKT